MQACMCTIAILLQTANLSIDQPSNSVLDSGHQQWRPWKCFTGETLKIVQELDRIVCQDHGITQTSGHIFFTCEAFYGSLLPFSRVLMFCLLSA